MRMLLVLLAQAASPPPAPATLASYFSSADYPREAIKRREQGTVVFRIEISPEGRISHCLVTWSSGSSALDQTTCSLATRRLRFKPATDAAGRPASDSIEGLQVTWRLPGRS